RRRTRTAIVDRAIEVLADRPDASLSVVAEAAEVSRSTLHRHFPGREHLIAAVDEAARTRFAEAFDRARPGDGDAVAALIRISHELLAMGPVLGLVFNDNAVVDPDTWSDPSSPDGLSTVIRRGLDESSLDRGLRAEWIETTVWTLLFGAWLVLREGASTADVAEQLSRTVEKAFRA
ncbi:MAG TPA: TetR/AcrR family transcriptional regulator, partial [Candidatus Avipropionibacterium avicola]|nr:TetR/AcrR family transcriptional regulator [Candidatus Avipropionibacterium avicola]